MTQPRDPLQILRHASLPAGFEERLLSRLEQESAGGTARVIPLVRRPRLLLLVAAIAIPTAAAAMATSGTVRSFPVVQAVHQGFWQAQVVVSQKLSAARLQAVKQSPLSPPEPQPLVTEEPSRPASEPIGKPSRGPAVVVVSERPSAPAPAPERPQPIHQVPESAEFEQTPSVGQVVIEVVEADLPDNKPVSLSLSEKTNRLREATKRAEDSAEGKRLREGGTTDTASHRGKGGEGRGEGAERRVQEKAQERARKGQ